MTSFDHYQKVANHVVGTLAHTKTFIKGEVIDIQPPYAQLDIFGLGKERDRSCPTRVNGNLVLCFAENRGKAHKLISDTIESLSATRADGIYLEDVEWTGSITKYNDSLFAGEVKFTTRS